MKTPACPAAVANAAVDQTIFSAAFVVLETLRGPPSQPSVDRAKADHSEATEVADHFLAALGAK
jgi:hypothetical protein